MARSYIPISFRNSWIISSYITWALCVRLELTGRSGKEISSYLNSRPYPQNPDAIDKIFLQAIKDWRLLYNCMDETVVAKSSDLLLEIHHQYDKRGG